MNRALWAMALVTAFWGSPLWAGGQKELPPTIPPSASPVFLAPTNPGAAQRYLTLNLAPGVSAGQALKAWSFTIYDATGTEVWSLSDVQNKDRGFLGELFNLGPRVAVAVPDPLVWDGTYLRPGSPENGKPVPDGTYSYLLTATDTAGRVTLTPPFTVTVGNSPVTIDRLQADNTIFSPLGKRSTVAIQQSGSREPLWVGAFTDNQGKTVRTFQWANAGPPTADLSPPTFAWDGKDDSGVVLPDGEYHYALKGANRAGAVLVRNLDNSLVISEGQAALRLTSNQTVFSPRADRSWPPTMTFRSDSGSPEGLVDWTLAVRASPQTKDPLWVKLGKAPLPNQFAFDGKDALGRQLPDGHYEAVLSANFSNGNTGVTSPVPFELISRLPLGELKANAPVFGGSGRRSVKVEFVGEPGLAWSLDLVSPEAKVLKTYPLGTTGSFSWELPGSDLTAAQDGRYWLVARTHDAAGNPGTAELTLVKDTRARQGTLDLSRPVLVPGKGTDGQVRITPVINLVDTVVSGTMEIVTETGEVLAQRAFDGPPLFWDWSGTTQAGTPVIDGAYLVRLTTLFSNGEAIKTTVPLKVDSLYLTAPQGTLTASSVLFGGASRPQVKATFAGDPGFRWNLEVLDAKNKTLRQYDLGTTGGATVDVGTDTSGKPLPDGPFTLRASARNAAGLVGQSSVEVTKDSRPMGVSLDLTPAILVPGNPLNGTLKVTPVLEVLDSIVSTRLSVNQGETSILEKTWTGLVPFWTWDGTSTLGKVLPDGAYQVAMTVQYANGTQSQAQKDFRLDSGFLKEPQGTLASPELVFGGSGRNGVTITFEGDQGVPWTLEILDKDGKSIQTQSLGLSGHAQWDFQGNTSDGKALADGPYTVKASATSQAGITGTALLQLRKDSRQGKASLDLSGTVLVPGKGTNGIVRITPLLDFVDSVDKMVVSILGPNGKTVNEKSSDGPISFWDWDGRDASQKPLANGDYQVALTVAFSNGSLSRATTTVKLDSTYLNDQGPLVEMSFSSKAFAPNNVDGPSDLTVFIKTIEGVVPVSAWQLTVLDPRGKEFRHWSGVGVPPSRLLWDGKSDSGDFVESGEDYQVLLKVSDTQGHVTRNQGVATIDISVVKVGDGKYKIVVSSIHFAGYSADIFQVEGDLLDKNLFVLRRLADALGKFPGYKIQLGGYAVSEFWNDPKTADWEQKTQLLPLSLHRAQAVRNVLVLLGITAERFAVQGYGALTPVVPNSDLENRWKNRRVEFYLEKS